MRDNKKANKSKKSAASKDIKVHTSKRQTTGKSRNVARVKLQVTEIEKIDVDVSSGKKNKTQSRGASKSSRDRNKGASKVSSENTKHVAATHTRSHKPHKSPAKDSPSKRSSSRSVRNKTGKSDSKKSQNGKRDSSITKEATNQAKNKSRLSAQPKVLEKQRNISKSTTNRIDVESKVTAPKETFQKPTSRKQSQQNYSKPRSKSPTRKPEGKVNEKKSNGNSQNLRRTSQNREPMLNSQHSKPQSKPATLANTEGCPMAKRSAGPGRISDISNRSHPKVNQPVDHYVQETTRVKTFEADVAGRANSLAGLKSQDILRSEKRLPDPVFESARYIAEKRVQGLTQDLVIQLNELIDEVANKEIEVMRRSSSLEKQSDPIIVDECPTQNDKRVQSHNSGVFTYSPNRDPVNHEMKVVRKITEVSNQIIAERSPVRANFETIEDPVIGTKTPSISDSFLID